MKKILTLVAALGLVFTAQIASAETYAFLIGINDYPDVLDKDGNPAKDSEGKVIDADLSGCVNDIKNYSDLLVNKFGLKPANIKAIYDRNAGETGFLGGIDWLAQTAKPGDQILFVYSGHGTQIPDKAEEDGFEEAIVLGDEMLVTGDFFNEMASALTKGGINSTFVFDSCYSGGLSRNVFQFDNKPGTAKAKFIDGKGTAVMKKVAAIDLDKRVAKAKAMPAAATEADYAFLFAGAEDQPTTDLDFEDPNTPDRGLFSLLFGAILEDAPDAPLEESIVAIRQVLEEKGFKQKPGFDFSSPGRGKKGLIEK